MNTLAQTAVQSFCALPFLVGAQTDVLSPNGGDEASGAEPAGKRQYTMLNPTPRQYVRAF